MAARATKRGTPRPTPRPTLRRVSLVIPPASVATVDVVAAAGGEEVVAAAVVGFEMVDRALEMVIRVVVLDRDEVEERVLEVETDGWSFAGT